MSAKLSLPVLNRLLSALPRKDLSSVMQRCVAVELQFEDILIEQGQRITHVYFPTTSFISLLAEVDSHTTLDVGLIGNEGMFGIALALGVKESPLRALVQRSGTAWRMQATDFTRALDNSLALRRTLNLYIYVLMATLGQTAICTHFHLLEARLARWLLMAHDRAHTDHLYFTHDLIARMLGVRRSGVTIAAGVLQQRKLINYSRGDITVLNRKGLEATACECYRVGQGAYDRLLG